MSKFKQTLAGLVTKCGGKVVDDLFVTKPGVKLMEQSKSTPFATELYKSFHFDSSSDYLNSGEFKGRITYLSYKNKSGHSNEFHDLMIKKVKHLSVYAGTDVTFLIAGVSIETALEFIAHHESRVARLTSSKTNAMNDTLYRVQDPSNLLQMQFIKEFVELRKRYATQVHTDLKKPNVQNLFNTEQFNMLNLCTKATAFTYSMNIKDLHKLFIGRLNPAGNEQEVQEVCVAMCNQLHQEFPDFFLTPEEYYAINNKPDSNGEKLNIV
jgi:hypothetical protein